jgi:hypothetical protein
VKPVGDVEVFGVVRTQHAMAHREVEDHQIDVELEIARRADAFEDIGER